MKLLNLDFLGMTVSILCALHCLAIPFLLIFLSSGSVLWMENPMIEFIFVIAALSFALLSLVRDYYGKHKNLLPIKAGIIGFLLLSISIALPHELKHFVTAIGGILLTIAHYLNWKISKQETANA